MNDHAQWAIGYSTADLRYYIIGAERRLETSPIGTCSMSDCGHPARGYDPACLACMRAEVERRAKAAVNKESR